MAIAHNIPFKRFPSKPIVCYVTEGSSLASSRRIENLIERIESAIAADVDWIQIRERDLSARELFKLTRDAVNLAKTKSARILVNDRLDVALAAGAGGVHLREESMPVYDVVRWNSGLGHPDFLIGASCHNWQSIQHAGTSGADYIFFGPVFETPTKRKFGAPQGVEKLADFCRATSRPVIAIGGITTENASQCIRAGAAGVAAIRLFQDQNLRDLSTTIARLHGAI